MNELNEIVTKLQQDNFLLGDIKKLAKEIKMNHPLSIQLWDTKKYYPRLLSVLILDKKEITLEYLNNLSKDIQIHNETERNQIVDWLLANQLVKSTKTKKIIDSLVHHPSPAMRRTYWFYQGRLRWTGKIPQDNAEELLNIVESDMQNESPEVQWAMNFCVGWIGVYDSKHRKRSIQIGEHIGLYKNDPVSKGCTPNYLPEFIRIESEKANT